jgi:hypothetical protein
MKKTIIILAFAMAAMFCIALAGCGSGGDGTDLSESKYVGSWKAVSMSIGDTEEPFEDGEYILTLNGDGTGTFESVDPDGVEESGSFTWEPTDEGFKTKGDTKLKFTDDGEMIHAKVIGVNLNFEKQ